MLYFTSLQDKFSLVDERDIDLVSKHMFEVQCMLMLEWQPSVVHALQFTAFILLLRQWPIT